MYPIDQQGGSMFRPFLKIVVAVSLAYVLSSCNSSQQVNIRITDTLDPVPSLTSPSTEKPSPVPTMTQTATPTPPEVCQNEKGTPFYMEFSPIDGSGKIAYSGDGLTLIDPPSSQIIPIHILSTQGLLGWDTGITWSPDGDKIAFLYSDKGRQPETQFIVLIADLSLGRICALTSEPGRYSTPAWSPDSASIALTEASSDSLLVVNIYNKSISVLENDAFEGTAVQWMSSQALLYAKDKKDGKIDLVLREIYEPSSSVILQDIFSSQDFSISPDGKWLAYYASGLKIINIVSKQQMDIGDMLPVAWSRDAQNLFAKAGMGGIFLLKAQENFIPTSVPVQGFLNPQSVSLDNRFIALEIGGDGKKLGQIGIFDFTTGDLRVFDVPDVYPSDPAWSSK